MLENYMRTQSGNQVIESKTKDKNSKISNKNIFRFSFDSSEIINVKNESGTIKN